MGATLRQYSLHGYHGATMKNIANEVGIKPASIYYFYDNKEELFISAFQQLLDNHQQEMERIFSESQGEEIARIFISMIRGLVNHHKINTGETVAYISLVNSPIPEIKTYLQEHRVNFKNLMYQLFEELIKENYPSIMTQVINAIIHQYVLLANGVFWSINLYEGEAFEQQVKIAEHFIKNLFNELNNTCKVLS